MKVLVKDIHQWKQEFEVAPSDPISSLKEKIMEERGLKDYLIKLIYKGKQLASESTFESYNIQDQELIIMLQTPISTQSNSAKAAGNIGDSNEEVIISKEPEAPTSTTAELEDSAEKLRTMGFPEHQIFPALKAAFGDANRAVEYLTNGLPENCMESFQDEDTKQAQPTLNLQPDTRHLSNPEFLRIIHNIQENPQILEPLLISIGRTNPDFLRTINSHQEDFLRLINDTPPRSAAGMAPATEDASGTPTTISITPEEKEAIDRLCDLGFDERTAVEAYFACDKNEELAANYLFDSQLQ
ncbi:uncharacterized protein LOC135145199 [Zophobas morio]|jgi:UV excision repair protein RAD23|uniref:uncharacterized protein LOC135145199 n=1 Tax=Zophobas morio TaxID=2755281 RepID=UPI0030827CD9